MNIKFVGIFVCIMLVIAVFPATGIEKVEEKEDISCGLSPKLTNDLNLKQNQIKNPIETMGNGKSAYGYRAMPSEKLVSFDLDYPGTQNFIADPTSSDFISGCTWVDGIWWGCEYSYYGNSKIWTIDHTNGEMTQVGESGSLESLSGLAYHDYTNTMYATDLTNLYTIDMETGEANLVGPHGEGIYIIGIAFDSLGNLYGECLQTDSLYSIDRKTGEATLIGSFGGGIDLNYAQDMAIDKETDICYLAAFTIYPEYEGALYTCNLDTGTATKVDTFGENITEITGLAIPYLYEDFSPLPVLNFTDIKGGFLTISILLKNIGEEPAFDIGWSINVSEDISKGFLFIPKFVKTKGTIEHLGPFENEKINIFPAIGLGKIIITFEYMYTIIPDKSDCELIVEGKQEWQNSGFLIINAPNPNEPPKQWVDIEEANYMPGPEQFVVLKFKDILKCHNVRVVLGQKSFQDNIVYQACCKFTDGVANLVECHVTKDLLMSRQAHWEVELVGDEIEK